MSFFYGNRYIAYMPKDRLEDACVYQVSLVPGLSEGELILPLTDENEHLKVYPHFSGGADAVAQVKKFVLTETEGRILELVCAIESQKLRIEERRLLTPKDKVSDRQVACERDDLGKMRDELKRLRSLRRAAISVLTPPDGSRSAPDPMWAGNQG